MTFTGMVAEHQCNQLLYSSEHPKPVLLQASFNHLHSHSHKHFSSAPESFSLTVTYTLNLGLSVFLNVISTCRLEDEIIFLLSQPEVQLQKVCMLCKILNKTEFFIHDRTQKAYQMFKRRKHIILREICNILI